MGKADDAREAWRLVASLFFGEELHDRFHNAADAAGVPHPGALRLLLFIAEDDPPSMRDLAAVMRCDASWVTALVDDLEEGDFVERRVSPTDRRVKLVHLTARGVDAKERARDVLGTPPTALGRLSAAETKTLARLLRRLDHG